jgi:C-terminal processing protease CtpA/Prc
VTRARARWIGGLGLGLALGLGACAATKGTIGAVLARESDGRLFVHEVPAGLGADEAGLETGDEILLIDGRDARALGPQGVHEALSGTVGETVKLTLVRKGQVVRVTVKRTLARRHALSPAAAPAGP